MPSHDLGGLVITRGVITGSIADDRDPTPTGGLMIEIPILLVGIAEPFLDPVPQARLVLALIYMYITRAEPSVGQVLLNLLRPFGIVEETDDFVCHT
jgi:hypothetical protein